MQVEEPGGDHVDTRTNSWMNDFNGDRHPHAILVD